jgi:hypothetical protein
MPLLQKILASVLCGLLGMLVFYIVGAILACAVFMPTSNLCGVVSIVYAVPLGFIGGAVTGWLIARRLLAAERGSAPR